ncbi:hypothetical protein [Hydrogenimonas sp. SS33]|uniref:hypothetical protein n=1 Tax=Hydrogenimonas leucolamina TaxID=2954236 RepID=UPI00336BC104
MRDRILSILFFGTLFWLAFVFIFYAGLFVNYIEHHGIPIFYNQFFADSQAWWLWPFGILLFGAVFMTEGKKREKIAFSLLTLLLAVIPWIPSFGEEIGRALFSQPHMDYRFNRVVIKDATILYSGRGYDYVIVPGRKMTLRYPTKYRTK